MFDHSIKVPRLYKTAAKVAREVNEGKGSIKQLVYEGKHPNVKAVYALVVQTYRRTDDIEILLKKSKLLIKEPRLDPWLAKILITELLWGKKRLPSGAKPIQTILAYEQIFKAHLSDVTPDLPDLEKVVKPRYVRVNTLKITIQEAIEGFRDEGWVLKPYNDTKNYMGFLDAVANLNSQEFMVDLHIPDLLVFPPKTQFYQHAAYKNSNIILQDKASCLPVRILNPPPGATILDMCAAPGMKTTQCAALIENKGVIHAVELRPKRFETLEKIVESSGATCVKSMNKDVITLTGNDIPDVEYILVDPSCSGSGLTDRVEVGQQKMEQDQERLQKLAGYQIKLLRHALTRFPKAKKVVYSTCSIFPEENEDVVRQVLETCTRFKLVPADQFINKIWLNYGSSEFGEIGNYCLYAKPEIDLTSGFFVAVFERLKRNETNPFLNENVYLYSKNMLKKKRALQEYLDNNQTETAETENIRDGQSAKKIKNKEVKTEENEEKSQNDFLGNEEIRCEVRKKKRKCQSQVEDSTPIKKESEKDKGNKNVDETNETEFDHLIGGSEDDVTGFTTSNETKVKKEKEKPDDCEERELKKKQRKKNKSSEENTVTIEIKAEGTKKKKSKNNEIIPEINDTVTIEIKAEETKKKKKKRQNNEIIPEINEDGEKMNDSMPSDESKTKKKKNKRDGTEVAEDSVIIEEIKVKKEKKKKNKCDTIEEFEGDVKNPMTMKEANVENMKKKKQKTKTDVIGDEVNKNEIDYASEEIGSELRHKKKKKDKSKHEHDVIENLVEEKNNFIDDDHEKSRNAKKVEIMKMEDSLIADEKKFDVSSVKHKKKKRNKIENEIEESIEDFTSGSKKDEDVMLKNKKKKQR